ncbi:MAG: peptide chain release factor 1 [Planctomycetota bacterium]
MSTGDDSGFLEAVIEGTLRENLDGMKSRFEELEQKMNDPDVQQGAGFQDLLKEHGAAQVQVGLYRDYLRVEEELADAQQLVDGDDPEMAELAAAELEELHTQQKATARKVREHLLDQQASSGSGTAIIEIRAGTGGDEAALFAADVFKMYSLYAERYRMKIEVLSSSDTPLGGFKDVCFAVKGKEAFTRLRFESGGHRVQRVPETETQGRIHTSAITVAVLQEAEESDIEIVEKDLKIETFCASGPGGQKVNKTSSAVRMTHIPTGTVVSIQDEKSQHKNRAKAMRVLRSRIKEKQDAERREKEDEVRRGLIGSGDRSDRIRTYNFPQNRITDHRINFSVHSLEAFMQGDIDVMIDRLIAHDREQRVQYL